MRDESRGDVSLRAKSLKMLSALLSERGKVLSKDRLSELVWPDTVVTDESIARCIADIRKALDDERHEIVQTYPKQGYRLNVGTVSSHSLTEAVRKPVWVALGGLLFLVIAALTITNNLDRLAEPESAATVSSDSNLRDTVAILPFRDDSGRDGFLAAGLSDDLEIHLAELSGIRILSRGQTGSVPDPTIAPAELARAIDSRYIVLGNFRRDGSQVALAIQLVDGSDGATLWADRYEGPRSGLIDFRNSVPEALAAAMSLELSERDLSRLAHEDTDDPEALELVMLARRELSLFTFDGSLAGERLLRSAVAIDPNYARAYAELASAYVIRMENNWTVLTESDTQKAFYFAERALQLDPDLWFGHYALGRLHSVASTGDTQAALRHLKRAMALHPASDDARVYYGIVLMMTGKLEDAREILRSAIASHPHAPFWYHLGLANALFHLQDYEEALAAIDRCLAQMPNSPYCLRIQIAVLARLGRLADADWSIGEYAMLGHEVSLDAMMKSSIEKDPTLKAHLREAYRLAGVK